MTRLPKHEETRGRHLDEATAQECRSLLAKNPRAASMARGRAIALAARLEAYGGRRLPERVTDWLGERAPRRYSARDIAEGIGAGVVATRRAVHHLVRERAIKVSGHNRTTRYTARPTGPADGPTVTKKCIWCLDKECTGRHPEIESPNRQPSPEPE